MGVLEHFHVPLEGSVMAVAVLPVQVAAFARDVRADLLLLSTHGRAGLDGTVSGSIAAHVLGELRIPTMLVRVAKVS